MHVPVLTQELISQLKLKSNENFIDCTLGQGGHTAALLKENKPKGKALGIERDTEQLRAAKENIGRTSRVQFAHGNFADITEIVRAHKFRPVHAIFFDLGFSSDQLEKSGRGFSFQKDEPLDMRYDTSSQLTAEKILNFESRYGIERLLKEYGEERYAKQIAQNIVRTRAERPIRRTFQLVEIIERAMPPRYKREPIHPATRTFLALRIAVNDELEHLRKALPQTVDILSIAGRVAVISFHSLEDRIVKRFFLDNEQLEIQTKKPIRASNEEVKANKRSRSAKLRVAIKIR